MESPGQIGTETVEERVDLSHINSDLERGMTLSYQDCNRFSGGHSRIAILVSTLSFAMCVVAISFWIRSYFVADELMYSRTNVGSQNAKMVQEKLFPGHGVLDLVYCRYETSDLGTMEQAKAYPRVALEHFAYQVGGHNTWYQIVPQVSISDDPATSRIPWRLVYFCIHIPYWIVVAIFAVNPIIAFRQRIQHKRVRNRDHGPG